MEFKEESRLRLYIAPACLLLITDLLVIIPIVWLFIDGNVNDALSWIVVSFFIICMIVALWIAALCFKHCVVIDKEKIEVLHTTGKYSWKMSEISHVRVRWIQGTLTVEVFFISPIYFVKKNGKISGKPQYKFYFSTSTRRQVCILRHYIPQDIPWENPQ